MYGFISPPLFKARTLTQTGGVCRGQVARAIKACMLVIENGGENRLDKREAYRRRGKIYGANGEAEKCLADFKALLEIDPTDKEAREIADAAQRAVEEKRNSNGR